MRDDEGASLGFSIKIFLCIYYFYERYNSSDAEERKGNRSNGVSRRWPNKSLDEETSTQQTKKRYSFLSCCQLSTISNIEPLFQTIKFVLAILLDGKMHKKFSMDCIDTQKWKI